MRCLMRLGPVAGLLAAAVVAMSAMPAGGTIVCPKGIKPPSPYCKNVKPTAVTRNATHVGGKSATLNGLAGAGVAGGDPTQFFFQYGTTMAYGKDTPTRTLGSCPSGTTPPSLYCTTPASTPVSARISALLPCTTYHFRLVAKNADGKTKGADKAFKTKFVAPIVRVESPRKVGRGQRFNVSVVLSAPATVTIFVARHGRVVNLIRTGPHNAGKFTIRITAPNQSGRYVLGVVAKENCGSQTVTTPLQVVGHRHRHGHGHGHGHGGGHRHHH
jgi:hypothetical protein